MAGLRGAAYATRARVRVCVCVCVYVCVRVPYYALSRCHHRYLFSCLCVCIRISFNLSVFRCAHRLRPCLKVASTGGEKIVFFFLNFRPDRMEAKTVFFFFSPLVPSAVGRVVWFLLRDAPFLRGKLDIHSFRRPPRVITPRPPITSLCLLFLGFFFLFLLPAALQTAVPFARESVRVE